MKHIARLRYYFYDGFIPVFLINVEGGGLQAWVYEAETGGFQSRLSYVKVMFDPYTPSDKLSRADFIQEVEARRGRDVTWGRLKWEGPLVPLYERIQGIVDRADPRAFRGSENEALVRSLRERTHELFEADLRARGGLGLPEVGQPVPVDPKLTEPISPDWLALPDDLVADLAHRLADLGRALHNRNAEAVAAVLGRPIAEADGTMLSGEEGPPNRWRLDSRLPLTKGDIWITDRDGHLTVDIPLTDSGRESRPAFSRFLFREYKRVLGVLQTTYDRPYQETGGRWPERSWNLGDVGVFARRGGSHVHLLAMPQENAAARFETVVRESIAE